jgi:hypothetical protein
MARYNRKISWVHVTFNRNGTITILFTHEKWTKGAYIGKRVRTITIQKGNYTRMHCIVRLMRYSPLVAHTLVAWDGYSVCFESRIR